MTDNWVFVSGTPVPQGSMKGFAYTPKAGGRPRAIVTSDNKETKPWRALVSAEVRAVVGPTIPFPTEPVALRLVFVMPRRKAEPKRITPAHTRKPDGDKLSRAIFDSLKGLVYGDDAQVVELNYRKRTAEVGEHPGAYIEWTLAQPSKGTA